MSLDRQNVGPIVKAWRAKLGLSREKFASWVDISPGALWRIESKNSLKPGEYEKLSARFDADDIDVLPILSPSAPKAISKPIAISIEDPPTPALTPEMPLLGVAVPPGEPFIKYNVVDLPRLPGLITVSPTEMSQRDGYRRISNSEVQTWKRCRRKWWFAYYRKLKPKHEEVTGVRSVGIDLHEALRHHYVADTTRRIHVQDALEAIITRNWLTVISKYEAAGEYVPLSVETEFRKEADLMRIMIEGYLDWLAETGADSELEVTGSEVYLEANLSDVDANKVKIIGRLDARVRRTVDGARLFIDHKSVGNFQQLTRVLHMNEQMLWYILLELLQEDESPVTGALYNMLRRVKRGGNAKPPFYERIEVHHNKYEIESFKKRLIGVVDDILMAEQDLNEGKFAHQYIVYPTPTTDCAWSCPFFQVCGMTDDGSYFEGMLKEFFTLGDPLSYYVDPTAAVEE